MGFPALPEIPIPPSRGSHVRHDIFPLFRADRLGPHFRVFVSSWQSIIMGIKHPPFTCAAYEAHGRPIRTVFGPLTVTTPRAA